MKVGVVTFPGTLDSAAATRAVELAGGEPVELWHEDSDLHGADAVILPGGATYGNYVRPGGLAALSPIMATVAAAAKQGLPVLGIGNGLQILCEAGILPGGFVNNEDGRYTCRDESFKVSADSAWTSKYEQGEEITLPLRTATALYVASDEVLEQLEEKNLVVLRFVHNPTGSAAGIAGIRSEAGNVVGVIASPENAVEAGFGPETATGPGAGTDGLRIFTSVIAK